MAHAGQVIEGQNGYRLRIVRLEPELLEMEAGYAQAGTYPPAHFHPNQDEHFEVLGGSIRTLIDGEERTWSAGESFDVPRGTVHQMTSADGPARLKWEARPALRLADFFERIHGGDARGAADRRELPRGPRGVQRGDPVHVAACCARPGQASRGRSATRCGTALSAKSVA